MKKMETQSIFHPSVISLMWTQSIMLSICIFAFSLLYASIQMQSFTLLTIHIATAATGGIMIGISFALSGFCYYFNFLDRKIAYRKYIGLVGYYFALTYSVSLLFINPDKYFFGFFTNIFTPEFILGILAMSIFTFMAVVSNNWAMKKLGVTNWRYVLRLGYIAYFLLIIRAAEIDAELWKEWFTKMDTLPPVRLVLSLFALGVLILRVSMVIHSYFIKKKG